MNTYAEKKRAVLPHEQGADLRQESIAPQLNAMQNIDVHSGHSLRLEEGLKSRIEQHLGYDLSGVELRESADAADIGAEAFAKGNVVHFAPGQFNQHTERGQHLIAHELSHVVQQAKGGVHADVEGFNVNSSAALEGSADHAGDSEKFCGAEHYPERVAGAESVYQPGGGTGPLRLSSGKYIGGGGDGALAAGGAL